MCKVKAALVVSLSTLNNITMLMDSVGTKQATAIIFVELHLLEVKIYYRLQVFVELICLCLPPCKAVSCGNVSSNMKRRLIDFFVITNRCVY